MTEQEEIINELYGIEGLLVQLQRKTKDNEIVDDYVYKAQLLILDAIAELEE